MTTMPTICPKCNEPSKHPYLLTCTCNLFGITPPEIDHDKLQQRIKELEEENNNLRDVISLYKESRKLVDSVKLENEKLNVEIAKLKAHAQTESKPHKCPVCKGAGNLTDYHAGFVYVTYPAQYPTKTCVPCKGTGIVWEPK